MAKQLKITNQEWTKFPSGAGDLNVLSTAAKRQVCHTEGAHGNPVCFKQLSADPAHPFTAGQFIFKHSLENTIHGDRLVAHTPNFADLPFEDANHSAAGTIEQGGFYLDDYRVPLEVLVQLYVQTNPVVRKLQINAYRPDRVAIDEDDQSDATITIDPNTEDDTDSAIQLANGTSTPGGEFGGIVMTWDLTEQQYSALVPVVQGPPIVYTHNKIGITVAANSAVAPITYSAYAEAHPHPREAEFLLKYEDDVGLQAPAAGAWYARLKHAANPNSSALVSVGD